MAEGALSDVKVLDLTWHIAGPYCTKLLADFGADVIKIEKPGEGDPARRMGPFFKDDPHPDKSGLFLHLNINKRGITLNLKSATGKKIFRELVKDIDILVENFSPGVMARLGFSYQALEQLNPRLVMTSISNFGQTGPYRDFKAGELILYGMAGEMYSSGIPEREPTKQAGNWILHQAGAVAATATMGAFYGARYQGIGQQVDLSIMETQAGGIDRRPTNLIAYQYTGEVNPRLPESGLGYPNGTIPCQDGYFQMAGGRRYWWRVHKMVGEPEFMKDPKWQEPAAQSDPDLRAEFEAWFLPWMSAHSKQECWVAAQSAQVLSAPLYTTRDMLEDPYFKERKAFVEIDHPSTGKVTFPRTPVLMGENPWQLRRPAPSLGQHNEEVYGSLGYSKEDMVKLREMGVI